MKAIHVEFSNEQLITPSGGFQLAAHLVKESFASIKKKACTEPCDGAVIRRFLSGQQPHEIDIPPTGSFDLSG